MQKITTKGRILFDEKGFLAKNKYIKKELNPVFSDQELNIQPTFLGNCMSYNLTKVTFRLTSDEKKQEFLERKTVVLDIESNGRMLIVGTYDGENYKYYKIQTIKDLEDMIFEFYENEIDTVVTYGIYDIELMLFFAKNQLGRDAKKSIGEKVFVIDDYVFTMLKNAMLIENGDGDLIVFRNILPFFQSSLYDSYMRFYDIIKQQFPDQVFDENTLAKWKEDKEKRVDFESLDFNNPETLKELTEYNKLDVIATYQLYLIIPLIYPLFYKSIATSSIEFILDKVKPPYVYTEKNGKIINGVTFASQTVIMLKDLYKGGIFDSNRLGYFPHVYKYDVNSMYPFMMTLLPRMKFIDIRSGFVPNPDPLNPFAYLEDEKGHSGNGYVHVYYGVVRQNNNVVASKGNNKLLFLKENTTSFFDFEAFDFQRNDYPVLMDIKYTMIFKITEERIFKDVIEELYYKRVEFKKKKDPREKVYKILLNSSYGKLGERMTEKTDYKNVIYASMITALGRTFITRLMNPAYVISYLTDSVISTEPLNKYIDEYKLGFLKKEGEGEGFVIGNGIYVIESKNSEKMVKSRGFNISEEIAEKIIKFLAKKLNNNELYTVNVQTRQMIKSIRSMKKVGKIGLIDYVDKKLTPLNAKRRYVYENGSFKGYLLENEAMAKAYEKEYEKQKKSFKVIDVNQIGDQ